MRVGIVGLGYRLGYLSRVFTLASSEFEIVGYVDPAPAGLPYTQEHGVNVGQAYDSIEDLIDQGNLDLLMIGSPNHTHLDYIRIGLERGMKIFSEKPVVTSVEDTMALAELIAQYGSDNVMVGLVLRYAPLYVDLRRAQAEGQLGNIASIEASEHIPPYHGGFFMRDWRRHGKYAGGFMLEKCCHDIDLYNGVMGCRARYVSSFGGRRSFTPENAPQNAGINDLEVYYRKPSGWEAGDSVFDTDGDLIDYQTAMVQYENGAALSFHTNLNVPHDFRHFAVIGAKGMAEGDFVRNYFQVTDARTSERLIDKEYIVSDLSSHYGADEQMAVDILKHCLEGAPLPVSVTDALEAGLVALCMDEAMNTKTVVDMAPIWRRFDAALGNDA
ncbi:MULTISPECIES: Gfo/Idh/MocA family oxidoreductase [unclassified Devosia]|uniref:Gfo/Idh/MocA family protein n=1 Tax=unclassified Devosia TaxID=196773 RepID=UPI00145DD9A8|nr:MULTISPECIES: Gfo/Idh/MocA family oxidoreductase [unclassified Devosia]MBJ6988094.1 Gfo/Idh/MocA family oxidoreductase [Devosia sp. MC521]QMW63382.1 Gfo/Idh/MocA family oxidoreductase [Devosia sp. MC521]